MDMTWPLNRAVTYTGQPISVRIDWPGGGTPACLVIVIHGMAEHSGRYDAFTARLNAGGIAVARFDLPGHGPDAKQRGLLGHFADTAGRQSVVADLRETLRRLSIAYPDTTRILLGHSMGSLLARILMTGNTYGINACVLSGTMGKNAMYGIGRGIAQVVGKVRGPRHKSTLLGAMLRAQYGALAKGNAWLSRDKGSVDAYNADPLCGFLLTSAALADMLAWAKAASSSQSLDRLNPAARYLLLAGGSDPVGKHGRGVRWLHEQMKARALDTECRIYEGARHEVFNEVNQDDVYADLLEFLNPVSEETMPAGGTNDHD